MTETFIADAPEYQWLESRGNGWQFGEQGLIDAILERIGEGSRRCMEIGAGDGCVLPVTVDRLIKRGWEARLYEIVEHRQRRLRERYGANVEVLGEWEEFLELWISDGVVIIDIDGLDINALVGVLSIDNPAVLVCEHYDKQAPTQPRAGHHECPPGWLLGKKIDGNFSIQATHECLNEVASEYGYTLLGTTRVNSIFVRRDLVGKLKE